MGRAQLQTTRSSMALKASRSSFHQTKKQNKRSRRWADDDDDEDFLFEDSEEFSGSEEGVTNRPAAKGSSSNDYWDRVDREFARLKDTARPPQSTEPVAHVHSGASTLKSDLKSAISCLQEGLVERDAEARLMLLSSLSREHLLLLGPPGTAKSDLGRRLAEVSQGKFFQRLLTKFTTPEELFGPFSLSALENDEFTRKVEGYLPTADFAFLDEIFKANSAILNTLLTILNERAFDNGKERLDLPLTSCVAASNELPESEELNALYDRFLIRRQVQSISDDSVEALLLIGASKSARSVVDLPSLTKEVTDNVDHVQLSKDVVYLLRDIRMFLRDDMEVVVSDRRLLKAANLLKVSAASHGRTEVTALDMLLLQHCLWHSPEDLDGIREWLWDHVIPGSNIEQIQFVLQGLHTRSQQLLRTTSGALSESMGARSQDLEELHGILAELKDVEQVATDKTNNIRIHWMELTDSEEHLWLDSAQTVAAKQMLLPVVEARLAELNDSLCHIRCFQDILSDKAGSDTRAAVLERLQDDLKEEVNREPEFTEEELQMPMKTAKSQMDAATFRIWKQQRKKMQRK